MRIQVHPIKLGIVVMRNLNDINPELTSKLRERHYLEVLEALSAFTFRPILQLRLQVGRQIDPREVRLIVRFDYDKDERRIWQQIQPQIFEQGAVRPSSAGGI